MFATAKESAHSPSCACATCEDARSKNKPPLGLIPKKAHDKYRANDIVQAMLRYIEADKYIPSEWLDELKDLVCDPYWGN